MRLFCPKFALPTVLLLCLIAVALSFLGPPEKSLGYAIRLVYLHTAWVWTALAGIVAAAVVGAAGFLLRSDTLHRWSRALGRVGLAFWLTYIPLTMLAAQANWNGLFLAEPRWRVAFEFAIAGIALQLAATLLERPAWASAVNIVYLPALIISLNRAGRIMHPVSPIGSSDMVIQMFFALPLGILLLAAFQLARWWRMADSR